LIEESGAIYLADAAAPGGAASFFSAAWDRARTDDS